MGPVGTPPDQAASCFFRWSANRRASATTVSVGLVHLPTFLVRRRHYHDRLVAVHRGIGHAAKPEVDNAHDMLRPCRSAWAPWSC